MKNDARQKNLNSYTLKTLNKPFFVLAPMFDVTDTVFRRVISECAPPDLYFTEFTNVDGLQSAGRENLLKYLKFTEHERPIIAQIWGKEPENYYKTAKDLVEMGFDGIDINMGCPDKSITKNGCCAALINNRELAAEIIAATKEGAGPLPVSVKTRLGFNDIDLSWHEFLLNQKLDALSIHARTKKEMSKVSPHWDEVGEIVKLRDKLSPATKIIGNGDIMTRVEGLELAKKYNLDGIMMGRAVFSDPFVFAKKSPWSGYAKEQRIELYRRHVELFAEAWQNDERKVHTLNKFCKIYINGFDGAKELREQLMDAKTTDELLELLQ